MKILILASILFVLIAATFKQENQTFPEAATETANKALEMVSGFAGDSQPAFKNPKKTPPPPTVPGTVKMLKAEVSRLKENFRKTENRDKPSNEWVMPQPSKTNPAPVPETAPIKDVEMSVLAEPSAIPDRAVPEGTVLSGSSEQGDAEVIERLLVEASRNLNGIK